MEIIVFLVISKQYKSFAPKPYKEISWTCLDHVNRESYDLSVANVCVPNILASTLRLTVYLLQINNNLAFSDGHGNFISNINHSTDMFENSTWPFFVTLFPEHRLAT